jgi:hypothetical protein
MPTPAARYSLAVRAIQYMLLQPVNMGIGAYERGGDTKTMFERNLSEVETTAGDQEKF